MTAAPTAWPTTVPTPAQATLYRAWTPIALPNPAPNLVGGVETNGIVFFHGSYIAIGTADHGCCLNGQFYLNEGLTWTSDDGRAWTVHRIPSLHGASIFSLLSDGSRLFALGAYASGPNVAKGGPGFPAVWVSTDGLHWTRSSGVAPDLVAIGPHGLVGVWINEWSAGPEEIRFMRSTDGLRWTTTSESYPVIVDGLAVAADGSAMAVGWSDSISLRGESRAGTVAFRSADGSSWSGPEFLSAGGVGSLVAAGDGFLAAGNTADLWRLVGSQAPRPLGLGTGFVSPGVDLQISEVLAAGDAVVVRGDLSPSDPLVGLMWVSADGGATFGQVNGQLAASFDTVLDGLVETSTGLIAVGTAENSAPPEYTPVVWLAHR